MSERRGTKALELWCRRMTEGYSGVKIDNMTTSWRDGLAFCAMIHHFRPDLIDFDKLNKSDVYYNNALAFTTAEKYLGIPALLDADDMAAYEVPDRLSILTYLSQFYQVFAAQDAHNRLKRTSSSATDKTQITKSSGPPPKMAHVVGVPKRDPCRKCQLPVFLAERLMVGKKVYHRTCLKCARCGYQLTPGSFYETEIDEQYCCETCPDEEVLQTNTEALPVGSGVTTAVDSSDVELRNKAESEQNISPFSSKSVRSSIKDRLAFFENQRAEDDSDTKLLQKSLSDEEKSKSLQRMEDTSENVVATYKPNVALSTFLNNTVDDTEDLSESSSYVLNTKMETSDSEDDTDDLTNVSLPPELPKSLPPLEEFNIGKKTEEPKRFSVSAQLVLGSSPTAIGPNSENADEQQNIVTETVKENQTTELQINLSSSIRIDKTNNNNINEEEIISAPSPEIESYTEHQTEEEMVQSHPNKLENNLEYSENNDNDCTTKDKSADEFTMEEITVEDKIQKDTEAAISEDIDLVLQSLEVETMKNNITIEESVVELRTKSEEENPDISLHIEDNETTERLSVVRARLQQFEVITNNDTGVIIPFQSKDNLVNDESISIKEDNEPLNIELSEDTEKTQIKNIQMETEKERINLKTTLINNKVPLTMETKDNEMIKNNLADKEEQLEENNSKDNEINQTTPVDTSKTTIEEYPEDLNPFKSDDEDETFLNDNKENVELRTSAKSTKNDNLNPFDSSDDEVELEKMQNSKTSTNSTPKIPPPRPPPPRISKNPFGSEDEEDTVNQNFNRRSSLTGSQSRKTPIPTPRSNIEFYGSSNSLHSNNTTPYHLLRNSDVRSSNNSLNLSAGGTIRSRKSRRAPLPPAPVKELFPSNETINSSSKTSTPSSSTVGTPKSARKKRPAPAPPKPARLEPSHVPQIHVDTVSTQPKNLNSYPLQSEFDSKLSDEEKALLEGKTLESLHSNESDLTVSPSSRRSSKRLIPLDKELLEEHGTLQYVEENISQCDDLKQQNQLKSSAAQEEEPSVVYRRLLIPQNLETPTHEHNPLIEDLSKSPSLGERQLEKLKDNKEANNRNRQSQISVTSSGADDNDPLFNKSAHGKWKRRKGPAPALPIPPRKVLQMLPLQEIKHELEIIEVQQQGLEKQGVILEKMIRDRCEGENGEPLNSSGMPGESGDSASGSSTVENSKEVENLILQLFELVNEKNELFRRQAELMYLRRQHRLEQEQADLEYEIRILMAQPERNKTDSDKAREEALIERLVEVVKLRNEVVECLEMDRLREAEEDQSIKQRLESHIAKREDDSNSRKTLTKLSKKEKKKQKEAKKLGKSKKLDADKDADESELDVDKQKTKKKKKLLIF
ncbi:MICAL-like protein 1 isoform X2 [Lucilia sericata]|uniref:MICAL-like protein 1 isoform X2 n=2 Tax=Lucilia sericata TaxID=13632 RepID=UPI0018A88115|nr:MICAL-like protein 1 isoform X2 [Lucilia sericata]